MGEVKATAIAVLGLCISISCFSADGSNIGGSGNLKSKYDLTCAGAEKPNNKSTPIELYSAAAKCSEQGAYAEAGFLFAWAGVYGRFDSYRASDKSAPQVIEVLKMQLFISLGKDKGKTFRESALKTLTNPDGHAMACEEITKVGPPDYYPRYMIQHGMSAILKNGPSDGLITPFDVNAAWKQSLVTYLECGSENGLPSANASGHVTIAREVLLEKGNPVTPYAMGQTKDGGYVVAGAFADNVRWATKVDTSGNVLWRYSAQVENRVSGETRSKYESLVVLPDDGVLLCGWKNVNNGIFGVLTLIDKAGKVLSERTLVPQGDNNFRLNYLNKCVAWGDGVAAIGISTRFTGDTIPRHVERFSWLLALDAQANAKWEKLIPAISGYSTSGLGIGVYVSPNQDLVGDSLQVNLHGDITSINPSRKIREIVAVSNSNSSSAQKNAWVVQTRFISPGEVRPIMGKSGMTQSNAEYFLPDHSLVEFGGNVNGAAIAWLSATSTEIETYVFKPYRLSNWINAAIPTGKPGEFATVRQWVPLTSPPDPEHFGVVLAFINVQ